MEKIKVKFLTFYRQNRLEVILIGIIAFVALCIRLYKIDQYMTFLGDEGRDVRVLRDLLRGNLVFIGPQTSIGNMYLGPFYYYLVAPALALSGLNPVGPAIMIAFISTLTIILTWYFGRVWFDKYTGLIAAILFTLSPVSIIYSRSSWNPNPMPTFSLLAIWSVWQVYAHQKTKYIIACAVSMALALQMHYLGLLLLPVLGIYWLLTLKAIWKVKKLTTLFIRHSIIGVICFLILMSPLALFDLKHNFMNIRAFSAFFSDRQTTVNLNPARSDRFVPIISQVTTDMVTSRQNLSSSIIGVSIVFFSFFVFFRTKQRKSYGLLLIWLFFGILGLSIYKQHVYAHYYGFIYPAIYLLLGFLIRQLGIQNSLGKVASLTVLSALIWLSIQHSPLKETPNNQAKRTKDIVSLIIKESNGDEFNFGLIAKQNYDESYRYYLENEKARMVRGEDKISNQLFVVCEDGQKCQPEGNPAYQVAIFGPSKVVQEWNVNGIRVYKMLSSK